MRENLGHFLVDLACNPQLMAQFLGDPETVLAQSTLTPDERSVVLSRDPRLLSDALGSTGYTLGEGQLDEEEPRPRQLPGKKKKTPRKPPAKKGPAKPSRKAPSRKSPAKKAPGKSPSRKPR